MKLRDLLPIRFALKAGPMMAVECTILAKDEEVEVSGTTDATYGFVVDPVDEVQLQLEPFDKSA